tara:strand:+ start:64 stop:258 length:195 start_codon:yes stop_codon:yes gene_type:complete
MTKKDYIILANTINKSLNRDDVLITNQDDKFNTTEQIVFDLCNALKQDNSNFNRQTFIDVCMKS